MCCTIQFNICYDFNMGRPKNFSKEEVLENAIPVFWKKGFADTSLQDLEKATGVNKSGLYSEFESKEEIFLESLKYYLLHRDSSSLKQEPLGWQNIRNFLLQSCPKGDSRGCLAIYSMRELSIVPSEAQDIVSASLETLKRLLAKNVAATSTKADADSVAGIILTFFTGLCLEQNLGKRKSASARKIERFVEILSRAQR
jgi:TetR/AcrR family transcriptional regulator, copper-responsive repressor